MKKDIFLVDADDTVLDFHGVSSQAVRGAIEGAGFVWKESYEREYRLLNDGLWQALERKELSRDELMNTRFSRFLAHLGLEGDGDEVNRLYIEYLSTHPKYFDGGREFLRALRRKGRIYIVTNGTESIQRSRFSILDLEGECDGIFISQSVGADKPDHRYTEFVTAHIEEFSKARAVWIGDSLSADIQAAKDAQIDCVWFNPQGKPTKEGLTPTFEARNYAQILDWLEKKP